MRGYLSLMFGSLIIVMMLAMPGNAAQAKTVVPPDCDCDGTYLVKAEGNEWVSKLLDSEAFKNTRNELKQDGFKWAGSSENSVFLLYDVQLMIRTPFIHEDGTKEFAVFGLFENNFVYLGKLPADAEH